VLAQVVQVTDETGVADGRLFAAAAGAAWAATGINPPIRATLVAINPAVLNLLIPDPFLVPTKRCYVGQSHSLR
jgi:hypothetical protein